MQITIFYRTDLKMRKGKLAAQCAHALMGFWLSFFRYRDGELLLDSDNYAGYRQWRDGIHLSIQPVPDESALLACQDDPTAYHCLITDQGRTEFHGQPTRTCLASGAPEGITMVQYNEYRKAVVDQSLNSKQVIVVNRTLNPPAEYMAHQAAMGCWLALAGEMHDNNTSLRLPIDLDPMSHWILGRFTKITLKATTQELFSLLNSLPDGYDISLLYTEPTAEGKQPPAVAIMPPAWAADVDKITGKLPLY